MNPSVHALEFTLNGQAVEAQVQAHMLLIDLLRDGLLLRGTKRSCDMEVCGACTVLVDDQPLSSCTTLAVDVDGKSVLTIEGLSNGNKLDPIQEAFVRHGAIQCGFCTPGFVLATRALLLSNPKPSRAEIMAYLSGNICRCTGYRKIIEAVESLV